MCAGKTEVPKEEKEDGKREKRAREGEGFAQLQIHMYTYIHIHMNYQKVSNSPPSAYHWN